MLVVALILGALLGLAVGAVGGGGSILAVPVLVYLLGESVHAATTGALLVVVAAGTAGAVAQARTGVVCWRCVATLTPAAALGTLLGAYGNAAASGTLLLVALVPAMVAAGLATWRSAGRRVTEAETCPTPRPVLGAAAGLALGTLTGFLGVGGGFLVVPLLLFALGFPLRRAIGTSLVVVALVSLASLGSHLLAGGGLDLGLAGAMAAGAAAGAVGGAAIGHRLPRVALGRAFAGLVLVVAGWIAVSVLVLGGAS